MIAYDSKAAARGGMRNQDVALGSNATPILVAAQRYWMRTFRELLPLRRN